MEEVEYAPVLTVRVSVVIFHCYKIIGWASNWATPLKLIIMQKYLSREPGTCVFRTELEIFTKLLN